MAQVLGKQILRIMTWGVVLLKDPSERRGGVGSVAAGDDAEQAAVAYQMGYLPRELTIDFQARPKCLSLFMIPSQSCPPQSSHRAYRHVCGLMRAMIQYTARPLWHGNLSRPASK